MISFEPNEEQQMLIDAVRRFAENEMRTVYRDCEEEEAVPTDLVEKGWEIGLVAAGIPEEYEGLAEEHSALTGALFSEEPQHDVVRDARALVGEHQEVGRREYQQQDQNGLVGLAFGHGSGLPVSWSRSR